ncbi:LysE family translocator [Thalassovita mediterranea]|jgi:threonine/homoserine/homoserine lactone efflux protein|uniref:Threonine efflux protein n=1 Tax=Thalassovita mediterranea TaxID=340021 RepID=A0A0P1H9D2_9RHOB|nr:LysE family translocator [Thalassovita mediterranea]CUH83454.1 Threonine efflux protein [Thalassovita mediterranea]SIS34939.1 Threonine/homoserine/homoserine lactone efflux protein [Thalassovita mediterranea]
MMDLAMDQIWLLMATQLVALLSPGPAVMSLMQQSFAHGRGMGLRFGLGLGLAATIWASFAFAGLSLVFAALPWLFSAMKIIGAAYLIWMALQIWRSADRPVVEVSQHKVMTGFTGGLLTNFANPKAALYYSAVFVTIFPDPLTLSSQAAILGVVFGMEMTVYTGFVLIFTTPQARALYIRAKSIVDRLCGATVGVLGLSLLINR